MREYLRGLFLVGLIVVAVLAVLVAGGLTRPQSEQSRSIRDLSTEIRSGR